MTQRILGGARFSRSRPRPGARFGVRPIGALLAGGSQGGGPFALNTNRI